MTQETAINALSGQLNLLSACLKSRTHDATVLEGVCGQFFSALFGWQLINLNQEQGNFPGIDLGDEKNGIAIQVTVHDESKKATHTLEQIDSAGLRQRFDCFICFFLVPKAPGSRSDDPADFHRWGIRDLIEGVLKPLHLPEWLKPHIPATHHTVTLGALRQALAVLDETLASSKHSQPPPRYTHRLSISAHEGFIGREDLLQQLQAALQPGKDAVILPARALHADGGVGKTSLAAHLGWLLFEQTIFDYVLFLGATSRDNLQLELSGLCERDRLNLPSQTAQEQEPRYRDVLAFLKQPANARRSLLILDGADEEAARAFVHELRQELPGCAFLITSRHTDWGKGITGIPVDLFSEKEALAFLRDRFSGLTVSDATLHGIAQALDHLPLGLEIAASYIRDTHCSPAAWLAEWQQAPAATLTHYNKDHLDYPLSLARVWEQSVARLPQSARAGLHILAWIAPRPTTLPLKPFESLPTWPQMRSDLAVLAKASLIRWEDAPSELLIHRLLQMCMRASFSDAERQTSLSHCLHLLHSILPDPGWHREGWQTWEALSPHLQQVLAATESGTFQAAETPLSSVLNQSAYWNYNRAQYAAAEPLFRRALQIDEVSYGSDHPEVAIRLNNLATLFQATSRLAEAEEPVRRALKITEASLGPNHPSVAIRLNNLATLLQSTNRLVEAEAPMRRVISIFETGLGPNHPNVATALSNLAQLLKSTSRPVEAEALMRRALQIDEVNYGADHPDVATDLNNLAQLLQDTNRLAEAEEPMRRVVSIFEASLGPDHPNVAIALNNLATLLKDTNRQAEAEGLLRRALQIDEASYGLDHPDIARDLNNLATLLQATQRLTEAEKLMRRMVVIFAKFTAQTGHTHRHLRTAVDNYAGLLRQSGQPDEKMLENLFFALVEGGMTREQFRAVMR